MILAGRGQINEGTRIGGEKGSPGAEVASLSVEHYSSNWKLPGAVDFCSAVRLWVTGIIFALRARKEQIFYQHLNHLSSAREEGPIAQLHTHKLMRTRRGASGNLLPVKT